MKKSVMSKWFIVALFVSTLFCGCARAAGTEPTLKDVAYGPHERNALDFWKAESVKPAPLVIFIHGGGFIQGGKGGASDGEIKKCLAAGVSFASINYPYYTDVALHEIIRGNIARALQYLRSRAAELNIDKDRIAVYGESAGAGSSLWLAFHDDIADAGSADPVLRESSRVAAAGGIYPQATYDLVGWSKLFEGVIERKTLRGWLYIMEKMVLDMYHLKSAKELKTEEVKAMRKDLDMLGLIGAGDPPVYFYSLESQLPRGGDILHHPRHAEALKEKCDAEGVEAVLILDETPEDQRVDVIDFLLKRLAAAQVPAGK